MAAMEEAKKLLYEKVIKKFTLQEITKHKTEKYKNLIEMISRYPNYGVGFKVYRKWWPQNMFYHVRKVDLYSPRHGKVWGIKYINNELAGNKVEIVNEVLKRGMWQYSLYDPKYTEQVVTLDNGTTMDLGERQKLIDEKLIFYSERRKMMEVIKKPEKVKKIVKKPVAKAAPAAAAKGAPGKGGKGGKAAQAGGAGGAGGKGGAATGAAAGAKAAPAKAPAGGKKK